MVQRSGEGVKYLAPLFLVVCFLAAVFIRLSPGDYNVIFPYDQARDALYTHELVVTRHIPLLGPISDIPGVHHGAIYYYHISPLYALDGWDLRLIVTVFALVGAFTIFPLYFLAVRLFSKRAAVISVVLFVCSYEAISYSRWISNPVLAIPLFPVFLWLLQPYLTKHKGNALLVGIILGILIQLELVLGYLLLAVVYLFLRSAQKLRAWCWLVGGLTLGALPIVVSELKFHFQAMKGLWSYVFGSSHAAHASLLLAGHDVLNQVGLLLRNNLFGLSTPWVGLGLFMMIAVIVHTWKSLPAKQKEGVRLLAVILASSLLLFLVGKSVTNFFLVGLGVIFILLASFVLDLIAKTQKFVALILILIIVVTQLHLFVIQTQEHRAYVQVQQGVWFSDRMAVLDAVYAHVPPKVPFTVSVLGTPYGVRTAWSYYFWWYSRMHQVALPSWYGFAANGYVGDEFLPHVDVPAQFQVTIYEPDFDVAASAKEDFTQYQDAHTNLVQAITVSHHLIQFRIPKTN